MSVAYKVSRCLRPVSHAFRTLPGRTLWTRVLVEDPPRTQDAVSGSPCPALPYNPCLVLSCPACRRCSPPGDRWKHLGSTDYTFCSSWGPLFSSAPWWASPAQGEDAWVNAAALEQREAQMPLNCLQVGTSRVVWSSDGSWERPGKTTVHREAWRGPERPKTRWLMLSFKPGTNSCGADLKADLASRFFPSIPQSLLQGVAGIPYLYPELSGPGAGLPFPQRLFPVLSRHFGYLPFLELWPPSC